MSAHGLIDTGALLAILDRDDPWHEPCVEAIRRLRLPLLTSSAVLTELFRLLNGSRQEMETTGDPNSGTSAYSIPAARNRQQMLAHLGGGANLIPDAHMAALAVEHGLTLCSTDGDFGRFPDLKWENPLANPR
jgi:predicted nucleic acid-binding protein